VLAAFDIGIKLTRPELDGLLVAPKVPAHVERILRAVEAGPLSAEEEEHMIDLALLQSGQATLRRDECDLWDGEG
jgi:hypothetical protein